MSAGETPRLKGFDSYEVRLGDEMRGERASLGKSLLDVQRDLHIKAAHIDALENARPQDLPYRGFVIAYLRTYARYLGMDEAEVVRRFCAESGFDATGGAIATPQSGRGARKAGGAGRRDDLDAVIAGSRLAAASRAEAMSGRFETTLRGLGSVAMLGALVWGVGFGGWALLQNIQRVEFAPAPDAPAALADAPDFGVMTRVVRAGAVPAPAIDAEALAAVYAAQEVAPPRIALRDGPIAALNPQTSGVYARTMDLDDQSAAAAAFAGEGGLVTAREPSGDAPEVVAETEIEVEDAPARAPGRVALVFAEEAWVRVRDGAGATVHEALMRAGSRWEAPEEAEGLVLRAGNAGGVLVEIDGALYGPLGGRGAVAGRVDLAPDAVRASFPEADPSLARAADVVAASAAGRAP